MCSYLKNRKPRVAINNSASTTKTVAAEIPKGSADDPFLCFYKKSSFVYTRDDIMQLCL